MTLCEMAVKEVAGGTITCEPIAMQQKIVHVIWENELLDDYAASAQAGDKINRLREVDVAIVIAVDEKHRRLPRFNGGDRGRLVSELGQLLRNVFAIPIIRGPIVNAVEVYPGGEDIRIAREAHGREEPAVATAPKANSRGIDIGAALKVFSSGDDVFVFGGAAAGTPWSFAKGATVADAAAIVDREHNVSAASEILIHRVGIRVVIHVVPAEKHLAYRPAVHEDEGGLLFLSTSIRRKKELAVNFDAIGGVENYLLRRDQLLGWKVGGPGFGGERTCNVLPG